MITPLSTTDSAMQGIGTTKKDDPEKVKTAAGQFEALLIGQLMKSMHDSEGGWLGTGDDQSASSAMDYGEEVFAQSMAANGGLGISSFVAKQLQKTE